MTKPSIIDFEKKITTCYKSIEVKHCQKNISNALRLSFNTRRIPCGKGHNITTFARTQIKIHSVERKYGKLYTLF